MSLRVVAPTLTPRFRAQLTALGGALVESEVRGVHVGHLQGFALRVVETSVAWSTPGERLLYAISPACLTEPEHPRGFDDTERDVYYRLLQGITQLSQDPRWKAIMKDATLVGETASQALMDLLAVIPPEVRLAGVAPSSSARGLAPEQRLAGLAPEQPRGARARAAPRGARARAARAHDQRGRSRARAPRRGPPRAPRGVPRDPPGRRASAHPRAPRPLTPRAFFHARPSTTPLSRAPCGRYPRVLPPRRSHALLAAATRASFHRPPLHVSRSAAASRPSTAPLRRAPRCRAPRVLRRRHSHASLPVACIASFHHVALTRSVRPQPVRSSTASLSRAPHRRYMRVLPPRRSPALRSPAVLAHRCLIALTTHRCRDSLHRGAPSRTRSSSSAGTRRSARTRRRSGSRGNTQVRRGRSRGSSSRRPANGPRGETCRWAAASRRPHRCCDSLRIHTSRRRAPGGRSKMTRRPQARHTTRMRRSRSGASAQRG
jgi:hypothetical protein